MKRLAARGRRWPALLLALVPGLLAPKGCYFGAQDVPLGSNLDASAGGQSAAEEAGGTAGSDATGAAASNASGAAGSVMREPDVFLVH